MGSEIAPWNVLQFIAIATYTCFLSYFRAPEGGLSVLSLYISLLVLAVPVTFVQLKVGGYLQRGVVGSFSMFFPIWKGVGVAALLDLVLLVSTYAPVTAQLGTYAFIALSRQPYQWGSCDLLKHVTVQGEVCVEELTATAIGPVGATFHRPEEIFYKREFLQLSSSIEKIDGFPHWRFIDLARKADISLMPVTLACVWVLVSLFVGCGARVCGWVLFLLGLSGLSCLLTVLGYGYHNLDTSHAVHYLKEHYVFRENQGNVLDAWLSGFNVLLYSLPLWSAVACTMGKLCGRSRKVRNLTWLMLLIVFILCGQLPNFAMAPYLGNLVHRLQGLVMYGHGLDRLMWQMPAAFTVLEIPPAFAFVFFLSAFIFTLMFLCIGTLTVVDNIVEALTAWMERDACSKVAVHLLITFVVMVVAQGLGIIQTTKAGHYYFLLIGQSMDKLRFLMVILLAFGFLLVYVKQNFGLVERIVMGLWFCISALASSGLLLYSLYLQLDKDSAKVSYDPLSSPVSGYMPWGWTLVSWAVAGFPFVGVLLGAIHSCFSSCRSPSHKCRKLCCGVTERVREHNGDEFSPPPLLPSEPSAPPYMYSYMDSSHNGASSRPDDYHLDHYKLDYEPAESEPLTRHDRSTRI